MKRSLRKSAVDSCCISDECSDAETGMNQSRKKPHVTSLVFDLQILMSVDSMRLCVVLMVSVRTDWVPSDASVTRATRSLKTARPAWVSVAARYVYR